MNAIVQSMVVAAALLWSLGFMLRRQFPVITHRLQQAVANACQARGWHVAATWLQPAEKAVAGCDNGCSSCSPACAADKAAAAEQPVQWRQPPASGGCH